MSLLMLKKKIKALYEKQHIIRLFLYIPVSFYRKSIFVYKKRILEYYYSYIFYHSSRLYRLNDLTIGIKKLGEKKTIFPHPIGIVIGIGVRIGQNCTVYQNVTIGSRNQYDADNGIYPKIGNNVIIGCNSVIIGNINIGNNVTIGAATFVNCNIPDNSTVVGNPCRIVFYK
jgi:serine O-acetyltransferase